MLVRVKIEITDRDEFDMLVMCNDVKEAVTYGLGECIEASAIESVHATREDYVDLTNSTGRALVTSDYIAAIDNTICYKNERPYGN